MFLETKIDSPITKNQRVLNATKNKAVYMAASVANVGQGH